MAKTPIFYKVPNIGFVRKEMIKGTKHIQNKKTGRMKGRKAVKGVGKKYPRRRVKKDFILVHSSKKSRGHIRTRKPHLAGQFI